MNRDERWCFRIVLAVWLVVWALFCVYGLAANPPDPIEYLQQ